MATTIVVTLIAPIPVGPSTIRYDSVVFTFEGSREDALKKVQSIEDFEQVS